MTTHSAPTRPRSMMIKVPEVTLWFWVIKVACTTVGETAADFLNVNMNFGLTGTSVVTGFILVAALALQFSARQYVPGRYWFAVTLVSVFGTLVTDNLTDALGVPLETSTVVFGLLLALAFLAWYRVEGTLSIHSVRTVRREAFYWLAILLTFALGTATGDLMADVLGLGYLVAGLIVAGLITALALGWRLGLHPVLAFWAIYVLTRPLGASIGDYLSQPSAEGGLNLGATATSGIFVAGIIGIVVFLSVTKADVIPAGSAAAIDEEQTRGGLWQTLTVLALVLAVGGTGYALRKSALDAEAAAPADTGSVAAPAQPASGVGTGAGAGAVVKRVSPLGDLSAFRVITQDTLDTLNAGDQSGATTRVDDLEATWDDAQARLKARNGEAWTAVDKKIDKVLRELRATSPDPAAEKAALTALLGALS